MARFFRLLATGCMPLLVVAGVAYSHDVWLEPRPFVVVEGRTLVVEQLVGTELVVESELPLFRALTSRFELLTSDGTTDLLAELPDFRTQPTVKPVLERTLEADGQALVVMDHSAIENLFTTQQFLEYLDHEEFDPSAFRDHMGDRPEQSERYYRTLKALAQVGPAPAGDLHGRTVGQALEVLLLQDPYRLDLGDTLAVRVLFRQRPLTDRQVTAFNRASDGTISVAKADTDAEGVARFELIAAGLWLVRLVHLYPAPDDEVDWESYWTAYTFQVD